MSEDLIEKHEDTDWNLVFEFDEDFDPENPEKLKILDMFSARRFHIPRRIFDKDTDPMYQEVKALCGDTDRARVKTPSEFHDEGCFHAGFLCGRCDRILSQKLGVDAHYLIKALSREQDLPEGYKKEVTA